MNKLSGTVKKLCKNAGLQGKFTNHSLRATSASHMYQNNVPEQVIKEVTGHRSDCVRIYKHTTDEIRENASSKIAGEKPKEITKSNVECEVKQVSNETKSVGDKKITELRECEKQSLSVLQMVRNVVKTWMELRKKKTNNIKNVVSKLVKKRQN